MFKTLNTNYHLLATKLCRGRKTRLLIGILLILTLTSIAFITLFSASQSSAEWFDEGWHFRKKLTINSDQVSGSTDLVNFPVLVSITDDLGVAQAQDDGDDLVFTDINGNKLSHEIESYSEDGSGADLLAWVRVPTVFVSDDTIIYLYYGNPSAQNQENVTGVWDDDYVIVHHLEETTTGSNDFLDSTSKAHHSASVTIDGTGSDADAAGKIGSAVQFDGTDDSIDFSSHDDFDITGSESFTVSFWMKTDSFMDAREPIIKGVTPGWRFRATSSDSTYFQVRDTDEDIEAEDFQGNHQDGEWHYVVGIRNRDTNMVTIIFDDNSPINDNDTTDTLSNASDLELGAGVFDGTLDEIRISSSARSTDWSATEYNNQSNPGTFITTSAEEAGPGPIAWWKFDESADNTCPGGEDACDSTSFGNDGTFGATTAAPAWQTKDMCVSGACLLFDGSDDVVNVANSIDSQTISFWLRPTSATEPIARLATNAEIDTSSGTVILGSAFTNSTIYINGIPGSQLPSSNYWTHIAISFDEITANSVTLGYNGSDYLGGFLDEVKIYPYKRSAAQVREDYAAGAAVLGIKDQKSYLSDGLVGYWSMDHSSGDATDMSGNGITLTNNGTVTYSTAKFHNGSEHDPLSSQYFSTASTISGVTTIAFWINPDSTTNNYFNLVSGIYLTSISGTLSLTGVTGTVYINGVQTTTIAADTWQHVVIVLDSAVNANLFYAGRADSSYFDGTLEELRLYNRKLSEQDVVRLYKWAPSPVSHWSLDEGSGTTAYDHGQKNNHAVFGGTVNPTWVPGKYGMAVDTNGTAAFLDAGDPVDGSLDFDADDNYTYGAWVKTTTLESRIFIYKNFGGGAPGYRARVSSGGDAVCGITDSAAGAVEIAGPFVADGKWHHITCMNTGPAGTRELKLYVDGVFQGLTPHAKGSQENSIHFTISVNSGINQFYGQIDEVRVYNYERTPEQIVEDMNASHPGGGSPIKSQTAYFKFDEMQGQTIYSEINSYTANRGTNATTEAADPAWKTQVDCKISGCLEFNGSNSLVTVSNTTAIDFDTGLKDGSTFTAWVYADGAGSGSGGQIWQKGAGRYLRVDTLSGGRLDIEANQDYATMDANINVSSAIATGTWNHVVAVFNETSKTVSVYINGYLGGTSAAGSGALSADTSSLLIGGSDKFDGKIDEFKIYSSPLTAEQVLLDMNANASANFGAGTNEKSLLTDGAGIPPMLYYKMDDNSGTSVSDTSGNEFSGSITGAAWKPGKYGSSIYFDGNGDYINMYSSALSSTFNGNEGSIAFWMKPYSEDFWTDSTNRWIVQLMVDSDNYITINRQSSDNTLGFFHEGGNTFSDIFIDSIGFTDWTHIALTYSVSGNQMKVYINGTQTGEIETGLGTFSGSLASNTTVLGAFETANTNPYYGYLDDLKIYNYARTPSQIAYDYNRGTAVAWWKMDECQGSDIHDSSANLHGTLTVTATGGNINGVGNCETSSSAWGSGVNGKFSSSIYFDGDGDFADIGDTGRTDIYTLSFWAKPVDITESFMQLSATDTVSVSSGTVSAGGFGTESIYIDGVQTSIFPDTSWHMVTIVSSSAISANDMEIGRIGGTYYGGQIDDVRIYNYPLSSSQIRNLLLGGGAIYFGQ